jgi:hypothetical protein
MEEENLNNFLSLFEETSPKTIKIAKRIQKGDIEYETDIILFYLD